MKMYPLKSPVIPARVSRLERFTAIVAPAANVPSAASPPPGFFVVLVVKLAVDATPVLLVAKKSKRTVPLWAVAPPPATPNGSLLQLQIAIPVSIFAAARLTANGIRSVVFAGTILTTVRLPTETSENRGNVDVM